VENPKFCLGLAQNVFQLMAHFYINGRTLLLATGLRIVAFWFFRSTAQTLKTGQRARNYG